MNKLFSERYSYLIEDENFICKFSHELILKLIDHLNIFNEPSREPISRYDNFLVNTSAKDAVLKIYWENKGWNKYDPFTDVVNDEWFYKREEHEWFDIIEFWSDVLSHGEKSPFQTELNSIMERFDISWRVLDGKFIKIDSRQFEYDLINKALVEMEEFSKIQPEFKSAYLEFLEACENHTSGNNEYAILNACKSYESVLKVVLNVYRGSAVVLTKKFIDSDYMNVLQLEVKETGFQEKVLMSLPFLRNNIASHGDGKESYEVPESLARLSVHFAAGLNTCIIEQYRANLGS